MSVEIDYVSPSQRLNYRVTVPINVIVGSYRYKTLNWGLSGFKIGNFNKNDVNVGDIIDVSVQIPFQGFNIGFTTKAKVVTSDNKSNTLTAEYTESNERQEEILRTFLENILKGEMEPVGNVIKKLDVPVTPVSLKKIPTNDEKEVIEKKKKLGSIIYMVAGAIVTLLFATIIYTNLFQIKIKSAVLVAPTTLLVSPANGDVKKILSPESSLINGGEPMIQFTDPELEKDIKLATLKVEEAKISVQKARTNIVNDVELSSSNDIKNESGAIFSDWDDTKYHISNLEQKLSIKQAALIRVEELFDKGMTSQSNLDAAYEDLLKTQGELERARSLLTSAEQLLIVAENELDILKDQRHRLTIHAPKNGRFIKSLVFEGSPVSRGKAVGLFEYNDGLSVQAFITPKQAVKIKKDTKAMVYFPYIDKEIPMVVKSVDAVSGAIDTKTGTIVWKRSENNNDVAIKLVTSNEAAYQQLQEIPSGSTAVAVFDLGIF